MTTFECILRESALCVGIEFEADERPAAGDTRWLCDVAAAMGRENRDRNRGDALLKVEANSLAASAGIACRSGVVCTEVGSRRWDA